jgi:SRSO17 transposase
LKPGEAQATTVAAIAAQVLVEQWQRRVVKEGTKGTIVADFAAMRVINSRQQLSGKEVWLVCRRNITTGELKYFLSNAPAATSLATFATISGMRWPIETCFEEGKQDLGLGDYQVRSWTGWHHHMTLVILAHFFLVRVRKETPERASRLILPQAILLLKFVLPQPEFDVETTIKIINYYQDRHEAARRSHSKQRSARIERLE